jgi:hypothetical protein
MYFACLYFAPEERKRSHLEVGDVLELHVLAGVRLVRGDHEALCEFTHESDTNETCLLLQCGPSWRSRAALSLHTYTSELIHNLLAGMTRESRMQTKEIKWDAREHHCCIPPSSSSCMACACDDGREMPCLCVHEGISKTEILSSWTAKALLKKPCHNVSAGMVPCRCSSLLSCTVSQSMARNPWFSPT